MHTLIREARPSDKSPLMEFIRDIWGGHDYIPRVWDEWIRDRRAKMFVAEVDGKQVGMNRVRILADRSAWFEGVRIHPDYRGLGLASMLGRNSMRFANRKGATLYRLTSGIRNEAAHRQVAKIGFKEASRMSLYVPREGARFTAGKGVRLARERDFDVVARLIRGSEEYKAGSGVYWDGFAAISLTSKVIFEELREGNVYLCDSAVAIAKPGKEGNRMWRQVCFATGESADVIRIVRYAFGRKERYKTSWRMVYVPRGSPLVSTLRRAGLKRWGSFVLFERKPPNG